MAFKKKQAAAGAPEWCLTYGDLVTNLLVFFVLLVSMSEIKKEQRFVEFAQAIREAFGYVGGVTQTSVDDIQIPRNVDLKELLTIPIRELKWSRSPDEGIKGKDHEVTSIRPANHFVDGAKLYFEPLSTNVAEVSRADVDSYVDRLRGFTTQIMIRGHCSKRPVDDTQFQDHFDLSYQRARTVAGVLIARGIDRDRIILVAAGTNEPLVKAAYTPAGLQENDFVELVQLDRVVED